MDITDRDRADLAAILAQVLMDKLERGELTMEAYRTASDKLWGCSRSVLIAD